MALSEQFIQENNLTPEQVTKIDNFYYRSHSRIKKRMGWKSE